MTALKFAKTHNLVAFLEKPKESDGFAQIVDFLNAHPINYALTVNPTIYTSCIEQFWATAKAKTVNGEVQLQALVDGKKVIITETTFFIFSSVEVFDSYYSAMPNAKTTAWNKFSSTMASVIICLATNNKFNFSKYIFETQEEGEGSAMPTDPQHTPTISQPSTSQPQKKQPRRKQRKDTEDPQLSGPTEPVTDDTENVASVTYHLSQRVLALETTKTNQALEIDSLKRRGSEDASKQGRKTVDLDADAEEVEVEKANDKSKAKMIEPKKPLKRKDQIMIDEEIALNLQAQLQDELEEEESLLR
ncbi:hypothetical protein Tco_0286703 [Tanacetum coccineum]